jgi:hypothetical protein
VHEPGIHLATRGVVRECITGLHKTWACGSLVFTRAAFAR